MKKKFLNLGIQPLANSFLSSNSKKTLAKEFFYNLEVSFDTNSYLVSISNPVNPKLQYTDKYAHRASESMTMRSAFKKIAKKIDEKYSPKIVMEIGSNDGVFIRNFSRKKVIAIEPCKNLANLTKKKYKTFPDFWNKKLAKKIFLKSKKADVIFSANTISHIPDLKETFDAIEFSLSDNGVLVIEDPSLYSVIKNNSYDQFYDEHVYVFSAISVANVVKKSNLRLFDAEKISTHGGSMRFYICKDSAKYKNTRNIKLILKKEKKANLQKFSTYLQFSKRVKKSKKNLIKIFKRLKNDKKNIISYGATYKSSTVFNYCKIGKKFINYITDTTLNKQGKFTPGQHIPIISPEEGMNNNVDYAFLGAWNFKKEILKKEKEFIRRGGKFITHVPLPKIISK
jgi:methylation protein EvaC